MARNTRASTALGGLASVIARYRTDSFGRFRLVLCVYGTFCFRAGLVVTP